MEVSTAKRERNKPCDQCRARKVKCAVEEGSVMCVRCIAQGSQCVFTNSTGSYDRKRPSPSSGDSPQVGNKRRSENNVSAPRSDVVSPASNTLSTGRDEAIPPNSLLNRTIGLANGFHAKHLGASSPFPRPLFDLTPNRTAYMRGDLRKVSHEEYLHTVKDSLTLGHDRDFEFLDEIEACVAPHGLSLINLYFRIVHPSYPILHKNVFYEKYARTYREFSPPLLAAVYCQALQFWEYGRGLEYTPKPNEKILKRIAHESLHGVCRRPKLSTVQALLLLAQGHEDFNWMLIAQATSVGFELGLHLDCSQWIIPTWEKGLRKRLAWAIYMQDIWGALVSGRPTLIKESDWLVEQVTEADFPERSEDEDGEDGSTEVEKGRVIFTRFVGLTQILAQVLDGFWSLAGRHRTQKSDLPAALAEAKPLQILLKDWYAQLPAALSLDNIQPRKLCSVGYLHLGFWAVQAALHRALLAGSILAYGSAMCEYELIAFCQSAAAATFTSAASLIQQFRPEHLQSFWYFTSSHSLSLIAALGCELWAGNTVQVDRGAIQKQLEDLRWTLRISAKGAPFLDPAVENLNQMLLALQEAQEAQLGPEYHGIHGELDWPDSAASYTVSGIESEGVVDHYYYPSYADASTYVAQEYYNG